MYVCMPLGKWESTPALGSCRICVDDGFSPFIWLWKWNADNYEERLRIHFDFRNYEEYWSEIAVGDENWSWTFNKILNWNKLSRRIWNSSRFSMNHPKFESPNQWSWSDTQICMSLLTMEFAWFNTFQVCRSPFMSESHHSMNSSSYPVHSEVDRVCWTYMGHIN